MLLVDPIIKKPINNFHHLAKRLWEENIVHSLSKTKATVQHEAATIWKEKFNKGKNPGEIGLVEYLKRKTEPKGITNFFTPLPKVQETKSAYTSSIKVSNECKTPALLDTNVSGFQFKTTRKQFVMSEGQLDVVNKEMNKQEVNSSDLLVRHVKEIESFMKPLVQFSASTVLYSSKYKECTDLSNDLKSRKKFSQKYEELMQKEADIGSLLKDISRLKPVTRCGVVQSSVKKAQMMDR